MHTNGRNDHIRAAKSPGMTEMSRVSALDDIPALCYQHQPAHSSHTSSLNLHWSHISLATGTKARRREKISQKYDVFSFSLINMWCADVLLDADRSYLHHKMDFLDDGPILSVMGGEPSHLLFVLVNTRTMETMIGTLLPINMMRIEKIAIRLLWITTLGTGEKLSRTDSQLPSRDHKFQKWTSHANNSPVDGTEVSWEDDRIDAQDASYFLQ